MNAANKSASDKLLQCPSDSIERTNGFTRSYSMNAGTTWMYSGFLGVGNEQGYSINIAAVEKPSELILLGVRFTNGNKRGGGSCAIMGNALNHSGNGVHGDSERIVYSFCDGHVSYLKKASAVTKQNR